MKIYSIKFENKAEFNIASQFYVKPLSKEVILHKPTLEFIISSEDRARCLYTTLVVNTFKVHLLEREFDASKETCDRISDDFERGFNLIKKAINGKEKNNVS